MIVETARPVAISNRVLQPSTRVEQNPFISTSSVFAESFVTTSSTPTVIPFSETATSSFEANLPKQESSIFDYISVDADAEFLEKHKDLTEAERQYYLKESVHRFLGEFAGKLPYSTISYLRKPDGLYFGSIKASTMFRDTARMTKGGSREWAELEGFLKVEAIQENEDDAVWISPSISTYGVAYYYEPRGPITKMHIITYTEEKGEVSMSRQFQEGITGQESNHTHTHHFLKEPIATNQNVLPQLLRLAGVSDADITKSAEFERRVEREFTENMSEYYSIISSSRGRLSEQQKADAEDLIMDMYRRACGIRKEIDGNEKVTVFNSRQVMALRVTERPINDSIKSRVPMVSGGGSCPIVRKSGFLSQTDISAALNIGLPLERVLQLNLGTENSSDSGYDCPDCGKHYADETHLPQEKRTKECACGFKFGC